MRQFFSSKEGGRPFFSLRSVRYSWPLWILGTCFYVVYIAMTLPLEQEYLAMLQAKQQLLEEKESLEQVIQDLEKRKKRQEDPRWQEMVLMRQLNLAETGWKKWIGRERT